MQGIEMKEARPSYVVFERRAVEDRVASLSAGRYMTKDQDFAVITPVGSKDRIPRQVDEWFSSLEQQAREERIPSAWVNQYKEAYAAWKKGEEIPLHGTPIKGWAVLSPAHQLNVVSADILTIEDLAQANDEAMKRIGLGALELRDKAQAWLKSAGSQGIMTQEAAALKAKNRQLENSITGLEETVKLLKDQVASLQPKAA